MLIFLISCKKKEVNNISVKEVVTEDLQNQKKENLTQEVNIISKSQSVEYNTYVKNLFVNQPFNSIMNCMTFKNIVPRFSEYVATEKYQQNTFNKKLIDTIITYQNKTNSFIFIKSDSKCFLVQSIITGPLELQYNVKIGLLRKDFLKLFEIENDTNNIVKFTDDEEYSDILFRFENDILIKIDINKNLKRDITIFFN
jgi:hypothetical protein